MLAEVLILLIAGGLLGLIAGYLVSASCWLSARSISLAWERTVRP